VVYFRFDFGDKVEVALVTSKAKVAPNKVMTIPRLELQAALLGARLAKFVETEHRIKIDSRVFWSDSKTVLSWILSADPRNLKPFVGVRVGEILDLTRSSDWRKIPTKLNVADDATKWDEETSYSNSNRWFSGPEFLRRPMNEWPSFDYETLPKPLETRNPVFQATELENNLSVIPTEKFSKYGKLVRVVAYCIKFMKNVRTKHDRAKLSSEFERTRKSKFLPVLSASEVEAAEDLITRKAQIDGFPEEYFELLNHNEISVKSSLFPLSPFMDEKNVIRINSRLKNAPNVEKECIQPAILPNKGVVTDLVTQHYHERFAHQYLEASIAAIRRKFWIIHTRSAVKRIKSKCQYCKNRRAKPVPTLMGNLPLCRLDWNQKPFTHTGMDMFGPVNATLFRRTLKCYVLLFTCMVTRAIHLEVVMSLSADDCIMNLRNFINRRGPIFHIYCDNATNFHGSHNELLLELENRKAEYATVNEDYYITWHFNPPAGSHFGGAFERLIQAVQKALAVVLEDLSPRLETLRSALIECENIVNSRPLTHVPIATEEEEPLTPNDFIKLHPNRQPPPGVFSEEDVNLRKQWRVCQQIAEMFWKKWREFYLPELTRRSKWFVKAPELQPGDVVLIVDNNAPRNEWRKGLIEQIIKGKDDIGRVAIVRSNNKTYTRPIMKLAKLDVQPNHPIFTVFHE
jgi:hypothetical protein